jgi:hypothetical protein
MKRYALFAGSHYYPCGGWHDLVGTYDSVDYEEAMQALQNRRHSHRFQVIDLQTGEE